MRRASGLFWWALLTLFVAATLQSGELITVFGIKPNLVLVLLAVFVFFATDLFAYALLALFAALFLDFAPGLSLESGALLIVALLFFYVRDRFLSPGLLASISFSVLGTVLFYLLISPAVLYHEVGMVSKELLYNGLLSVALFGLTSFIYEKKGGTSLR
jgi:hypothetical protein